MAVTLYRLLADRLLLLPADEDSVDELVNVRLREAAPGCSGSTMTPAPMTTR